MASPTFAEALSRGSTEALLSVTPSGRVLTWSHGAALAFGYHRDEAIGRLIVVLAAPAEDVERVQAAIREAAETGAAVCDGLRRHKDGTVLAARVPMRIVRDGQGAGAQLTFLVGTDAQSAKAHDHSARKPAEPEDPLREPLQRVRESLRADAAAVYVMDARGELAVRAIVGDGAPAAGLAAKALATSLPVALDDPTYRSILGVSVRVEGTPVGVLQVATRVPRVFTPEESRLLSLGADLIGWSLAPTRSESRGPPPDAAELAALRGACDRAMESSFDPAAMLTSVARVLVPRLADWVAVDLVETTGRVKRAVFIHRDPALQATGLAAADFPGAQAPLSGTDAVRSARIASRLAAEPDAVRSSEEHNLLAKLGGSSWVTLPIAGRVRVLGAISLGQAAPERAFTPADIAWLRDLARRAALEVENARLHDMVARSRDTATRATARAKLLQDVAASLSEALTPTGVTEVVVGKAREALRATGGALAILIDDRTGFEIAGTVGTAEALSNAARRFPVHARVPLADAGRSKEIVALDSIPAGVARYPHLASSPNDKLGALVAVPLVVDGQTVGAMGLVFEERRTFDHEDMAFLRTLARQCGDAVERTRLLGAERSARASADVEARRAAFLADASRILATSFDYQQTLAGMARMLVPVYADWVSIHLAEPDGTITNAASIHADETKRPLVDEVRWLHRLNPEGEAGVPKVLRTGKAEIHFEVADILVDRMCASPEHATLLRRIGVRSQMIIPLVARGRTLGAISFRQSGIRRFGLHDVPLAEELALRAALAVDNARLFHQAQEAFLRREESLALLGTLLSSAPIGIAFFDRDMTVARMNDALLVGRSGVAPIGARIEDALTFLPSATVESFRAVLTSGQPLVDVEVHEETTADDARHWLASCYPVQTHEGEVLGVGLVMTEITARKKAEQALRESEERARLLVEGVKDHALVGLDAEGTIATWNSGAERLYGFQTPEILGRNFSLFHLAEESERGSPHEQLRTAVATGRCELEGWRVRKDGSRFYANVLLAPLFDESGALLGFSYLTRDLTEARRSREDLERARQQVARSEKLSTMGTLVSGVAHEIRTPLTAIANSVYMMKSRLDRAKGPEDIKIESFRGHMDVALDSVDRINRLVQDLRRFTKANVATTRSRVELQDVAQEALNLFRAAFRGRIDVVSELSPTGLCDVDVAQVQQMVINLLQNASDAMPHGGSVRLVTEGTPTSAVIRVIDTGAGMPPEIHRRMFEEFFTTKQEGTGLGLSIVRRIAETHGARIECDTAVGKGTAFTVSFPRVSDALQPA